jgi:hypothetical protein
MKNVQYLIWSHPKNTVPLDTLFWKLPAELFPQGLASKSATLSEMITLAWSTDTSVKTEDWTPWLEFPTLFESHQKLPAAFFEIRSRSGAADDEVSLLLSCLEIANHKLPDLIYKSKIISLPDAGADNDGIWSTMVSALEKNPSANTLWQTSTEELRYLQSSSFKFWPRLEARCTQSWESMQAFIEKEFFYGPKHPLKKNILITEKDIHQEAPKPRLVTDQLRDNLWSKYYGEEFKEQQDTFLTRSKRTVLTRHPVFGPAGLNARLGSLSAKASGFFVDIISNCVFSNPQTWNAIPSKNAKVLSTRGHTSLLFVGPWSSQNLLAENWIHSYLQKHPNLLSESMLWDASDNWIYHLLDLIWDTPGWRFDKKNFEALVKAAELQNPHESMLLFWGDAKILQQWQESPPPPGVLAGILGTEAFASEWSIEDYAESASFLSALRDQHKAAAGDRSQRQVQSVEWKCPDVKASPYGYDRAMAFPDQYMIKVHLLERAKADTWNHFHWTNRVGPKIWNTSMGSPLNTQLSLKRVAHGEKLWVTAGSRLRKTWVYSPNKTGQILLDDALRALLTQGSSLKKLHVALWLGYGERLIPSDQAALTLFFESFKASLQALGLTLDSLRCAPLPASEGIDSYLVLRGEESLLDPPEAFHGLRMEDECLYSIGPRAFQMEGGSTLLKFVRVFANYTSPLEMAQQLDLYQKLHELFARGFISSMYPIGEGGIAEALLNMALWGNRGVQFKAGLSAVDLFSGTPGRVLVGVLPQNCKAFEAEFKVEQVLPVAVVKGDKIWGLKLSEIKKELMNYEKDHAS